MDTLPKSERLRGKIAVSALMSKGRWGFTRGLKYCYLQNEAQDGPNRIIVSVPKRLLKRAVKRNLLKRSATDILFLYNSKEVIDFQSLKEEVETILKRISNEGQL